MTRTPTFPFDDRGMWRRLVGRSHPDAGGSDELFIWTVATRDAVCGGKFREEIRAVGQERPSRRREPSPSNEGGRVPFDEDAYHEVLRDRAVAMADAVAEPFGYLLRKVADCYPVDVGPLRDQQRRGASFTTLAAIGHRAGMTKAELDQSYRIAEAIPLSQRHAGHILSRLRRRAA
jgi:hypothetical protein